ncbi:hypothetical protein [Peribacillus frigoritolerans]|uniref:hypothetical protein n=1 Tax=Peribacillus frigoritolerans TaxID=450367 RepID=UPI0022806D5D|nr:hypothetical protein [Peribacillus frigoritolerans]MCY9007126.1 hypothetical protein [Peribacillus frigoritolerans]
MKSIEEIEQEYKMEDERKFKCLLTTWRQELEKENEELIDTLNKFKDERVELQTKIAILSDVLNLRRRSDHSIDDAKIIIDYDEIDGRLKKLQSEEQLKLEQKLSSKKYYNKFIILRINEENL